MMYCTKTKDYNRDENSVIHADIIKQVAHVY